MAISDADEERYRLLIGQTSYTYDYPDPNDWSDQQKLFLFPNWLIDQINNGGVAQAVRNSSGCYLPEIEASLRDLDLQEEADFVKDITRFANWHIADILVSRLTSSSSWIGNLSDHLRESRSEHHGFDKRFFDGMEDRIILRVLERFSK